VSSPDCPETNRAARNVLEWRWKLDRRVRRTREALHAALMALIIEKGFDAITVQDIIDEADVGRTTFYEHFTGKEALLRFGFERLREELAHHHKAGETEQRLSFLEPLLQHAKAHAGLYAALLGGGGGRIADEAFRAIVEELIIGEIKDEKATDPLVTALLIGALVGALQFWISAGAHGAGDDVAMAIRRTAAVHIAS
jgi:AcrR family transcriptional regulator